VKGREMDEVEARETALMSVCSCRDTRGAEDEPGSVGITFPGEVTMSGERCSLFFGATVKFDNETEVEHVETRTERVSSVLCGPDDSGGCSECTRMI
jgi:hypothetical protein